ncbi:Rv3654c family TadE-like protein [Gordonia sp. VNK21]|uniref:Rv3654c family TadE-like protein n=1 Tax=Gordonia sp. VNK21 TaxID=3382483 RepID=UPI0038D48546
MGSRLRRPGWPADQNGYATITAAAVIVALAALLIAVVVVGAAVLARHRAAAAADLGALAGAAAAAGGDGDPCAAARTIVIAQPGAARLQDCEVLGRDVRIRVSVPVRLGQWGVREAHARARAGPAG